MLVSKARLALLYFKGSGGLGVLFLFLSMTYTFKRTNFSLHKLVINLPWVETLLGLSNELSTFKLRALGVVSKNECGG